MPRTETRTSIHRTVTVYQDVDEEGGSDGQG